MRSIKYMFSILVMSNILATGCVPKKYLNYNELKNDLTNNNYTTILIVSTGTSGTNLFLDNLSEELNKRLKERKITTVYHHLGNNQKKANETFNEVITNNKFDVVIQFAQLEKDTYPVILNRDSGIIPLSNGDYFAYFYQKVDIRYKQNFLMRCFDISDISKSLVDVNLDLNIDFLNPGDYKKLIGHIISSLKIQ